MSRHLLVPMDDSETARHAFEHVLEVFPDAEITVVHAVDDLEAAYGGGPAIPDAGGQEDEPDFFADVRDLAAARGHGGDVETAVVEGTPADAILEHAREVDADAIVMGSEGRSGVSRVLLGSVAEAVARRASIPVTIVP